MPHDSTATDHVSQRVVTLAIEHVSPGPSQARTAFDEAGLAELAASIATSGIIQPVVVRGDAAAGYQLLAGERRWRAAQRAGLTELPAIVRNDLGAAEAAVLGLIENLQRESLGVMDTAHGLARLCDEHGLTHDAVARRIGKSRVYVTNYLRLRQLAAPVQRRLDAGELNLGHAKVLAGFGAARQIELARLAATRGMSVRQLEAAARKLDADDTPGAATVDHGMAELEGQLADLVGNAVRIDYDADRRRGELRIAFHDLDEFDGLLARLGYAGD
ncbi:ParB/RepB/Spo0J family partition protein [Endozoicomonas sp. G2_2]|uniref:ParB/RepB/Spo0J family partition protein n=1 Tax=Endozoicomonas sp. G2_2 TaxID=2821092 RepID=UPI001ADAFCC5|nr:ParB/RepB/Spo0J family partition protein [Endozoicomonas sp. G2_2]MBO9470105.1 ParB/RepB/Spo0J family partition protein [Endozoicomonas sp. G2_2]